MDDADIRALIEETASAVLAGITDGDDGSRLTELHYRYRRRVPAEIVGAVIDTAEMILRGLLAEPAVGARYHTCARWSLWPGELADIRCTEAPNDAG